MKIDPYYQRRRCSLMALVSGNIRFIRIFAGVPWRRGVNDSGILENVDFQGFRTLRLRHLNKRGQHYYVILFSPLSPFHWPFHWPQNTWPRMTLNTLNVHYYEQYFDTLFLHTDCRVYLLCTRDQGRCADCGSGPWSAEYLGSTDKLRIFRHIVRNLTNKANISI